MSLVSNQCSSIKIPCKSIKIPNNSENLIANIEIAIFAYLQTKIQTELQEVEISGKPTLPAPRVLLRARRLEPCRDQVLRIPGAGTENQEHGFLHTGYLSCVAQPPGRKKNYQDFNFQKKNEFLQQTLYLCNPMS